MTPSSANLSNLFFCLAFNKIINCILVYDVLGCLTLAAGSIWLTNTTCQNVMLSTSDERLMFILIDEIFSQFRMVLLPFYDSHNLYFLYAIKWGLNEVTFVHRTVWTWALRSITHRFCPSTGVHFQPFRRAMKDWILFVALVIVMDYIIRWTLLTGTLSERQRRHIPQKNVYSFEQLFPYILKCVSLTLNTK